MFQQQPGMFGGQQSTFGQNNQQTPGVFGQMGQSNMMQDFTSVIDNLDIPVDVNAQEIISCMKLSPQTPQYQNMGQLLVAASWDGTISTWKLMYNEHSTPKAGIQPMMQQKVDCPVLGICWQADSPAILLACADNSIKKWDLNQPNNGIA